MDKNDRNKVYTTLGASSHSADERQIDDFYATDPRALEMLLDETDLRLSHDVWEPACGAGHLSEVLTARGYDVLSTDLVDRGYGQGGIDFLSDFRTWHGDILTNPPYKHAQRFVEHSIELLEPGRQLMMFLKIQFLESKSRREMFRRYPPKYIYVFSQRILCGKNGDFTNSKGSAVCYAWYVWEKGFQGKPVVDWIG